MDSRRTETLDFSHVLVLLSKLNNDKRFVSSKKEFLHLHDKVTFSEATSA